MFNQPISSQHEESDGLVIPPDSPLKTALEAATALQSCERRTNEYYRLQTELAENLDQLFTPEHRSNRMEAAAGGRDPAGQAVRYLRSVSWEELAILLKDGKIEFPGLHPLIDQPLSREHAYRLKRMFNDHPAESLSASSLLGAPLEERIGSLTYREAIYLSAATIPLDRILNEHACGRAGGQVFSPFLSTTTGGPMMMPVSDSVSIEVLVPFPRAFPNWTNHSVEQESLLTELRMEDVSRIYHDEDMLMDDLLAPDSQLVRILPDAMAEMSYNRYHHHALTCWRGCNQSVLLPETWQGPEEKREAARNHLRRAYRTWGLEGLKNQELQGIRTLSEVLLSQ